MGRKSRIQINLIKEAKKILKGLACSAAVGLALALPVKATQYEVIKIEVPHLGYELTRTFVSDINNNGRVVGTYQIFERMRKGMKRPFVWDNNMFYEYKGSLFSDDFFGGSRAVNDSKDVIIFKDPNSLESLERDYICFWGRPSDAWPIDFVANDINNKRYVAGENYYAPIARSDIEICPDSNDFCVAYGINDDEIMVGYVKESPDSSIRRPSMWKDGQLTLLPLLDPYEGGYALKINNQNQTIGYLTKAGYRGYSITCLWDNGSITKLSPLTEVYGINDYGRIVGSDEGRKALVWDNGEVIDLNSLVSTDPNNPNAWDRLNEAVGINNNDWIIGYGYLNEDRDRIVRKTYAFLARPKQHPNADIDNNGIVNFKDFAILAEQWMQEKE